MAKQTLREINAEILDLTEELTDAADVTEQTAIIEALDALALQREQKLENIAYVRLQQKSDIKAIDAEIKRLQARKCAVENAGCRLDGYVMEELKKAGIKRHKGELANLTVAKSPVGCEIVDAEAIPEQFTEERVEVKILKSEAIQHYKTTGENIGGMRFYQNEHLRIK